MFAVALGITMMFDDASGLAMLFRPTAKAKLSTSSMLLTRHPPAPSVRPGPLLRFVTDHMTEMWRVDDARFLFSAC